MEGVAGCFGSWCLRRGVSCLRSVHGVIDLHPVDEEEAFAEAVMAPGVWFVAVEAEALAAPFRHLSR